MHECKAGEISNPPKCRFLGADKNGTEFVAALDSGFRSGEWPGALRKAMDVSLAQRKTNAAFVSPYQIAQLHADLGDNKDAFEWLNTANQEHDSSVISLRTDFTMETLRPDRVTPNL